MNSASERPDRLRLTVSPYEDESLLGYLIRSSEHARLRHGSSLAVNAGFSFPAIAFVSCDLTAIAERVGTTSDILRRLSYAPAGRPGHHRFGDGQLQREFIDLSRRRSCGRCLLETGHHRRAWDLPLVTCCEIHGVRLTDRCGVCRRRTTWRDDSLDTCRCGHRISATRSAAVSSVESAAVRDVLDIATKRDASWISAPFARVSRADLVHMVMNLGMFLAGWSGQRRIEALARAGPERTAEVVVAGIGCLRDWPTGLERYLAGQVSRQEGRAGHYGATRALGPFYRWLQGGEDTAARAVVVEAARRFIGNDPNLSFRSHRSSLVGPDGSGSAGEIVGIAAAARIAGTSHRRLSTLIAEGKLSGTRSRRGIPVALDRGAVEDLACRDADRITRREMARILGVSRTNMRAMIDAGLLTRDRQGGDVTAGADPTFREVRRFLASFTVTRRSMTHPVDIDLVAAVLGKRGVTFCSLVGMMLEGAIPVRGKVASGAGLRRLRFERDEVMAAARHLDVRATAPMTRQAVAVALGVKWEVVDHLVAKNVIRADADGRIERTAVEEFRARFVTGADLARAHSTSGRAIHKKLAAAGIQAVSGPEVDGGRQYVFRRTAAEEALRRGKDLPDVAA